MARPNNPNTSGLGIGWDRVCPVCNKTFRSYSHNQKACSIECRFESYLMPEPNSGCWLWLGNINSEGYGVIDLDNKKTFKGARVVTPAHRYSYEKHSGFPIAKDLCVMHACDNPSCVNPAHLSVGSKGDNNRDRSSKGRSGSRVFTDADRSAYSARASGENNHSAKINERIAIAIYESTTPSSATARQYGISKTVVLKIRNKQLWRCIHE